MSILHVPKEFVNILESVQEGSFKLWIKDLKYCIDNKYTFLPNDPDSLIQNLNAYFKKNYYNTVLVEAFYWKNTNNENLWESAYYKIPDKYRKL